MIDYRSFLKGKTVAIVGPSKSLMYTEANGKYIDSFDVVVRINKGLGVVNRDYSGSKTDVMYNSLDLHPASGGRVITLELENAGVKFVRSPYPISEAVHNPLIYSDPSFKEVISKFSIGHIDPTLYLAIKKETNSRVNSGLGAIIDLLSFDLSKLYVTGIDFYRSSYLHDYNSHKKWETKKDTEVDLEFLDYDDSNHHNPDRQYKFFKKIYKKDDRIELDSFMSKVINNSIYDNWDTIPSSGY